MEVFLNVASCSPVDIGQLFRGAYCTIQRGDKSSLPIYILTSFNKHRNIPTFTYVDCYNYPRAYAGRSCHDLKRTFLQYLVRK
jgi:hypothetical protein